MRTQLLDTWTPRDGLVFRTQGFRENMGYWGTYSNVPKVIFYLLEGDYRGLGFWGFS